MSKTKGEFNSLVQDIIENKKFNRLNKELHHGITRYAHSVRVAKWTYYVAKLFNMKNINETTRAALLHDFYEDDDLKDVSNIKKLGEHPNIALENSLLYYNLNAMQQDIIKSHMFPCNLNIPKYKESFLVGTVDKAVSTYEMLKYKLGLYMGIYLLFLFEIVKIPK